ncbi:hypothetical protein I6H07_07495 [Hafnia alvei]|uniref:hypothetical protein n=1 Tax=Hafnia alvei TaxID=569 RepID=UPI000B716282|nr:hypothetical protein [Hafnia alvei]MBI0275678.1 hypothetical protein [Hafnia alvei]PNK93081.1 hypothetical protein CEQ28_023320 [Hafnia alvei]PNK98338.1 hypothetical protein CEQ28_012485 [Hafnia alvei]
MSRRVMEYLTFRPASETPTADLDGRHVLVLNPCDGWHTGVIRALKENDEVYDVGIYTFSMHEMTPHDFYVAWALLPDLQGLGERFENDQCE